MEKFPCHGQIKSAYLEIERLRREDNKLKAERDILKPDALIASLESGQPIRQRTVSTSKGRPRHRLQHDPIR